MVPTDRVKGTVGSSLVRALVDSDEDIQALLDLFEIVVFVAMLPNGISKMCGGRMVLVLDDIPGFLLLRWRIKISADQPAVPAPVVFGVGRTMYSHKAATRLDVSLKGCLLPVVEHIAGGV